MKKLYKSRLEWQRANREKLTIANREWRNQNLGRHFIHTIRERAKRTGLPFELTYEDLTPFPENCSYCGCRLQISYGKRQENSPSVDRLIPELGYTKQNSVVCCWKCNRWKNNMGVDELNSLAYNVTRLARERGL